MAHRTNVIQVPGEIESDQPTSYVVDPVCGKQIDRKGVHHMIFRGEGTFYFCSRECKEKYMR